MNSPVLALVVIGQIAVFQFASVSFTRSLFAAILGEPPEPVAGESATYLRKASRYRFILGALLLMFAVAPLVGIPADPTVRKILLAVVSLTSSGAFAYASLKDRRTVRSMREALPESGVKHASLQPRAVSHWHSTAWETVPIAILLATVTLTAILGHQLGHITAEMWILQILQATFVTGALVYTYRRGIAVPNVSSRLALLRNRPELALEFGEQFAAREIRYFMFVKIGVTLLLGIGTVRVGLEALEHAAAPLLDAAKWVIIAVLLTVFAAFVLQIATLTKRMIKRADS